MNLENEAVSNLEAIAFKAYGFILCCEEFRRSDKAGQLALDLFKAIQKVNPERFIVQTVKMGTKDEPGWDCSRSS